MVSDLEALLKRELRRAPKMIVSGLRLDGLDLRQRAVIGLEFRNCELTFCRFDGADLSLTRFVDCDLYNTSFANSVLYTTWFYDCNLTKANFQSSYMLGLRLKDVDLTKTRFDRTPLVGLERKGREGDLPDVLHVPLLGQLPHDAQQIETHYRGIRMTGTARSIVFLLPDGVAATKHRTRLRVAETAKYLGSAHSSNGYESQAAEYYVVERREKRRAMYGSVSALGRRAWDFVFGDLVWRYGSSVMRPILSFFIVALVASAMVYMAPMTDPTSGLFPEGESVAYTFRPSFLNGMIAYLNVLYFFLTAPAGGSQDALHGWVKVIFVFYILTALWLIALMFEASTRRLGRNG